MATKINEKNDIRNLEFPDSIRLRPGMYLGATDSTGIFQLLKEVVDNCVDESLNGTGGGINIVLNKDGSYSVSDNGRGFPFDTVRIASLKKDIPTILAALTIPHTSGKFDSESYAVSRGLNGVGLKVVNAMSDRFEVISNRGKQTQSIAFSKGILKAHKTAGASLPKDHPYKKGTYVRFTPDPKLFTSKRLPWGDFIEWVKMSAYLSPAAITVTNMEGKSSTYHYPRGVAQYIEDRVASLQKEKAFEMVSKRSIIASGELFDCALAFSNRDGYDIKGLTNGMDNTEGGVHVTALFQAVRDALEPYCKKNDKFTINELKDGTIGLINVKLSEPRFTSQTKERLVDDRAGAPLKIALTKQFSEFFKANKSLANSLVSRASELSKLKAQFSASKKTITALKKHASKGLPSKAALSPNCAAHERELVLVEGDSSSGSCRQARNAKTQECLPLKGKPKNAARGASAEKVLMNEEIMNVLAMIGFNAGNPKDPLQNLRVGKIILLADADVDGRHIASLILAVFHRFIPSLFSRGLVYISKAPEYYSVYKDVVYTGNSAEELNAKLKLLPTKTPPVVNHLKGWGECPPNILRDLAFNPATRELIRIEPVTKESSATFMKIMGTDVEARKLLLGID